jgi:hypothetical protein
MRPRLAILVRYNASIATEPLEEQIWHPGRQVRSLHAQLVGDASSHVSRAIVGF